MADTAAAGGSMTAWERIRAIAGGSAGNLVEWYDWFAYSAFSLYFARSFFPHGDRTAQLLQTSAIFAVGFLMRPIGAWLMGLYADRVGRKAALTLSVGVMSAGSFAMALIPGYASIGVAAPILLTLCRMVQGLSLGGEYGASATYMSEMAGRSRRGFWSSFQFSTLIAGQLISVIVLLVLQAIYPRAQLEAFGWRIPFVIGGILAIVVFWMRSNLDESGSFRNAQAAGEPRARTMMLFLQHPKETAAIFALTAAGSLAFYAFTTYMQKFLKNTAGFSDEVATRISAGSLLVYMLIQPLFGALGDRVGRKTLMAVSFGSILLLTYPLMTTLAHTHDAWMAFALVIVAVIMLSGYTATNAVVKAELFPTHVRALGVALPYALANAVFGGSAEYVALWLKQQHVEAWFYLYVSAVALAALIVALRLRETSRHSLILED
jgi:MHS family alpha-ketoglutarate permease-like MFS transporter